MTKSVRILTYHHITNFGAALFSYALQQLISTEIPESDVKILDYRSRRLVFYERLKIFRPHLKVPLFYFQRRKEFKDFLLEELTLDQDFRAFCLGENKFEVLITGMDVWNITDHPFLPKFPNVYWLPPNYPGIKIAFAVSAYRSKDDVINTFTEEITKQLSKFTMIGVRDNYTLELVERHLENRAIPLVKVPDPTFFYQEFRSGIKTKLEKLGVDFSRPILGLCIYGHNPLIKKLVDYFKSRGYQVIAFGMYHSHAEVNFGHRLSPHEWAGVYKYLSFCITDRYHGTIFCIKNNVPFVCLEPDPLENLSQSKIFDLVQEFELTFCYFDPHSPDFNHQFMLSAIRDFERTWNKQYSEGIAERLGEMEKRLVSFCRLIEEKTI
jgi:hypothetical protein